MKLNEQRYVHLAALDTLEEGLRAAFTAGGGTVLRPQADLLHLVEAEGDTYLCAVPIPAAAQRQEHARADCLMTMTALLKHHPRLTDEQINACNRYTALSHVSRPDGQQHVAAINSFPVFDDPQQRSVAFYLGLQTAVLQRSWLSQVLASLADDFRCAVPVLDAQSAHLPSRWGDAELELMFAEVTQAHYRARQPDPHGIVIHLSKPSGRGQGSFVIVRNDLEHPFYGNGLSITLALPEESGVSREQLERRALEWNRREARSILPTPCIGAWSSMLGRSQMQHQCFLPNLIYAPGLGQYALGSTLDRWAACDQEGERV